MAKTLTLSVKKDGDIAYAIPLAKTIDTANIRMVREIDGDSEVTYYDEQRKSPVIYLVDETFAVIKASNAGLIEATLVSIDGTSVPTLILINIDESIVSMFVENSQTVIQYNFGIQNNATHRLLIVEEDIPTLQARVGTTTDPEVIPLTYAAFKALRGGYVTHIAYLVTDVADALGLGAGAIFQFITRDPDDRYIGGVVQSSSNPIVIDVTTDIIYLLSDDKREVRGSIATVGMPHILRDELLAAEELVINNGERAVVIGPYTITGTVTPTGTGCLHVVTGADRTLLVFNAAGLPISSVAKVEMDGRLNLPVFAADPVTTNDGDAWIRDAAGTTELNVKVGGVIKRVELS